MLMLVWRTGYYTFLKTHIHHAGAHHLNEVILVFLIRLIINYLDVNCFAVDGKISIISKEQSRDKPPGEETGGEESSRDLEAHVCPTARGHGGQCCLGPLQPQWPPPGLCVAPWHGCA